MEVAARAFEAGLSAQLEGDYTQAARMFERAYRAAPAAEAIRAAIRNHRAAGALPRAATLSVRAAAEYPDADTLELTAAVLADAEPALGRFEIACEPACTVVVDGQVAVLQEATATTLFLPPGEHRLQARAGSASAEASVNSVAGVTETLSLALTEPEQSEPPVEPPVEPTPDPVEVTTPDPVPPPAPSGLSPVVTYLGIGVTAALGGVLAWSFVDVGNKSDEYRADPTQARLDDGQSRVRRTAILGVATGVVAITTVIIAVAGTRWSGDDTREQSSVTPAVWADAQGGGAGLSGSF